MDLNALEPVTKAAGNIAKSDKFATVLGMMFPFVGLKKKSVDVFVKEIENSDMSPEAKMMAIYNAKKTFRELKNQTAIAEIAKNAAKAGTDFSDSSLVDDDWLNRFMDSAKFVSDEETQVLWGNALAGEFESPGSAPPSIIRILSELTKEYASAFSTLCSLQVDCIADTGTELLPAEKYLFINPASQYLKDLGVAFTTLKELESMGLITMPESGYVIQPSVKENPRIHLVYGPKNITVTRYPDKKFPIGYIMLTKAGKFISQFVQPEYSEAHFRSIMSLFLQNGLKYSLIPAITAKKEGDHISYSYIRQQTK